MSQQRISPFIVFNLGDPEEARSMAQEIADETGRVITVTDRDGNEICMARPIRRNELMVLPKTLN